MTKKFLLKIALLMPVIGWVVTFNYFIDPAHLFQKGNYERGIADILLSDWNVANVSHYDDRLVQKFYIEGLVQPKDILIFGSSRSMVIHSTLFPGKTVFNHSVSGGSLEDHVAITELYYQKGLYPSIAIISLDPWLLNRNNQQTHWMSLKPEYNAAIRRFGLAIDPPADNRITSAWNRYQELISPSYFQESLRVWKISLKGNTPLPGKYYATDVRIANVPIRLSDGSLSYSSGDRAQQHNINIQHATTTMREFTRLDPELTQVFEAWVNSLQAEGIRVIFWLSPYHPDAYKFLTASPDYRILVDVQKYYADLAFRKHIPLLGSYNPADIPCSSDEFYDEQHPRESCMEKIWAKHP